MEYKDIDKNNYKLHIIKTDKFKTITIKVYFRNKIVKEEITTRNLLTKFLVYGTDTYPTKRDIIFKCEDLYAAEVYTGGGRIGNMDTMSFTMSLLNEKYTEKGMLEESVKFLADVIFNPNFKKEDKYEAAYNYLYRQYLENIKTFKEHKASYSICRMTEEMGKDEVYAYRSLGYLEDLESLTKEKLIDYYKKMMNTSVVDVFIVGNVDDDITSLFDKYFEFNDRDNLEIDPIIKHNSLPDKINEIKEEDDSNQSKLSIGCKMKDLTDFERDYVIGIYNYILGGSSESKFFQVIREKNSLAYHVSSGINKLDNLLVIKAGISRDNYAKVIELVKKLMEDMRKGDFTEEDIKVAKENYISLLNEIEDNPEGIISTYCASLLLGLGDIGERKKEILKVTKEDIISVSKKVAIDTIFLLEGVTNG